MILGGASHLSSVVMTAAAMSNSLRSEVPFFVFVTRMYPQKTEPLLSSMSSVMLCALIARRQCPPVSGIDFILFFSNLQPPPTHGSPSLRMSTLADVGDSGAKDESYNAKCAYPWGTHVHFIHHPLEHAVLIDELRCVPSLWEVPFLLLNKLLCDMEDVCSKTPCITPYLQCYWLSLHDILCIIILWRWEAIR